MKIAVLFPGPVSKPIGGYKIIYQYCDLLIQKFPNVEVNFRYIYDLPFKNKTPLKTFLKTKYFQYLKPKFWRWFQFLSINNITHSVGLDKNILINYDIIIVTAVRTAYIVKDLGLNIPIIYFIQGFENFTLEDRLVYRTYNFGYKNIVVSNWLKNLVIDSGAPVALHLPNPVDEEFNVHIQPELRQIKSILFMYHPRKWKGGFEALETLILVKKQYNEVIVSCFSASQKPKDFPNWINYYYLPSRKKIVELMNNHFIFLHTSYHEGYGLPPAEAMACGCCVITTNCGGVSDFAINNKTAFIVNSPPSPVEIANTIFEVFDRSEDAYRLATNGSKLIKKINWEDNLNKFSSLIMNKDES